MQTFKKSSIRHRTLQLTFSGLPWDFLQQRDQREKSQDLRSRRKLYLVVCTKIGVIIKTCAGCRGESGCFLVEMAHHTLPHASLGYSVTCTAPPSNDAIDATMITAIASSLHGLPGVSPHYLCVKCGNTHVICLPDSNKLRYLWMLRVWCCVCQRSSEADSD